MGGKEGGRDGGGGAGGRNSERVGEGGREEGGEGGGREDEGLQGREGGREGGAITGRSRRTPSLSGAWGPSFSKALSLTATIGGRRLPPAQSCKI